MNESGGKYHNPQTTYDRLVHLFCIYSVYLKYERAAE